MGIKGLIIALGLPCAVWLYLAHDPGAANALAEWTRQAVPSMT